MFKHIFTAAAGGALVAGLVGCTVNVTPPTDTTPAATAEEQFLAELDAMGYDDNPINAEVRSTSLEMAHSVCAALDSGATWAEVVYTIQDADTGYADEQLRIAKAGVKAFCPEYGRGL